MTAEQEPGMVFCPLCHHPEGPTGQGVPSGHLTQQGLPGNSAAFPGGTKSSRFCAGSSFPVRSGTAGEALAGPKLLPALWTSTAAEPNAPPQVGNSGKDK